ncbi:MAG: hypothetical protein KDK78_07955, partial [Chlamydiia bacterium]|nr:hypothetical protein [Chlamydiia bacterium]
MSVDGLGQAPIGENSPLVGKEGRSVLKKLAAALKSPFSVSPKTSTEPKPEGKKTSLKARLKGMAKSAAKTAFKGEYEVRKHRDASGMAAGISIGAGIGGFAGGVVGAVVGGALGSLAMGALAVPGAVLGAIVFGVIGAVTFGMAIGVPLGIILKSVIPKPDRQKEAHVEHRTKQADDFMSKMKKGSPGQSEQPRTDRGGNENPVPDEGGSSTSFPSMFTAAEERLQRASDEAGSREGSEVAGLVGTKLERLEHQVREAAAAGKVGFPRVVAKKQLSAASTSLAGGVSDFSAMLGAEAKTISLQWEQSEGLELEAMKGDLKDLKLKEKQAIYRLQDFVFQGEDSKQVIYRAKVLLDASGQLQEQENQYGANLIKIALRDANLKAALNTLMNSNASWIVDKLGGDGWDKLAAVLKDAEILQTPLMSAAWMLDTAMGEAGTALSAEDSMIAQRVDGAKKSLQNFLEQSPTELPEKFQSPGVLHALQTQPQVSETRREGIVRFLKDSPEVANGGRVRLAPLNIAPFPPLKVKSIPLPEDPKAEKAL